MRYLDIIIFSAMLHYITAKLFLQSSLGQRRLQSFFLFLYALFLFPMRRYHLFWLQLTKFLQWCEISLILFLINYSFKWNLILMNN